MIYDLWLRYLFHGIPSLTASLDVTVTADDNAFLTSETQSLDFYLSPFELRFPFDSDSKETMTKYRFLQEPNTGKVSLTVRVLILHLISYYKDFLNYGYTK
ncbi:uncharacterized protein LOC130728945 [Lotus japonicus]|uniref:uncharacterized protein LOC130728945 n=1 Tax=Lotus japonicus TaxID=34305 RepID=UPI00258AC52C|nr:uncharacterized protein LOC130728945 [Lotus japonicus]